MFSEFFKNWIVDVVKICKFLFVQLESAAQFIFFLPWFAMFVGHNVDTVGIGHFFKGGLLFGIFHFTLQWKMRYKGVPGFDVDVGQGFKGI